MLSGSSEILNTPRKHPMLTWYATWCHASKYLKNPLTFSYILPICSSLSLSNLSLSKLNSNGGARGRREVLAPHVRRGGEARGGRARDEVPAVPQRLPRGDRDQPQRGRGRRRRRVDRGIPRRGPPELHLGARHPKHGRQLRPPPPQPAPAGAWWLPPRWGRARLHAAPALRHRVPASPARAPGAPAAARCWWPRHAPRCLARFVSSRATVLATVLVSDASSHYVVLVLPDDDSALELGEKVLAASDPPEWKQYIARAEAGQE
jgi:hypothetical protein